MDKALQLVEELNQFPFLESVHVPILDSFHVIPNEGTIFTAVSDENYIEQFLCEGLLKDNETFEERLQKVLTQTKEVMKEQNLADAEKNLYYLKDLDHNGFNFKIYMQDLIYKDRIMRQVNAFFVDTSTKAFYEITLCTCPYSMDDRSLLNNEIKNSLIHSFNSLLMNVKKDTQ